MFSDRYRSLKMALSVAVLLGLGWLYTDASIHRSDGYRAALADPAAHEGAPLVFSLWRVTRLDGPDAYAISRTLKDVPVVGDAQGLELGDTVSLKGHFRAHDSALIVKERVDHPHRAHKAGLSALALCWAFWMVPRVFGWRERRVVLRG